MNSAQKLHAVTERFPDGRENPRFRDLVDLQLLRSLGPDLAAVGEACERVFAARNQQPWPPTLDVPSNWAPGYSALAAELDLGVRDVADAAVTVREFIEEIATSKRA